MQEKLYCYLCGMEDPEKDSLLCADCKDHMPADTQLEDWLDPTIVAAFLKDTDDPKVKTVDTRKVSASKSKSTYSGSGWDYYSTGANTYRKPCPHPGTSVLFSIGKKDFAAANSGGISAGERKAKAVIDCAGVASKTRSLFVDGTDKYKSLNDHGERDLIRLHWTDMGVPPVGRAFWRKLLGMLPEGHIVACCIGGHGRTGTCLASLLVANDRMPADKAIDFIRTNHCDRAIETQGQEDYIRSLQTAHQRELNEEYLARFVTEEEEKEATEEECKFCDGNDKECPACEDIELEFDPLNDVCEFCDSEPCNLSTTGCFLSHACEECGLLECPEICPNYDDGTDEGPRESAPFLAPDSDEEK